MENNYTDEEDILKNSNESDDKTDNGSNDESNEDIETLREELDKARKAYENQKIRAEKAEAQAKARQAEKIPNKSSKQPELSTFDIIAVTKADLDEESLKEVFDFAQYKNISVSEALKSPIMKAAIAERKENAKVAEATNTSGGRRGSSRVSDDVLMENAAKGIMPESDADLERLLKLRRNR